MHRASLSSKAPAVRLVEWVVMCGNVCGEAFDVPINGCFGLLKSKSPFQTYNDSFDRRRTKLSKKQRYRTLELELCDCNQWGQLKELRRLYKLDDARRRRQEEMADIREHLRTNFRNAVGQLRDAKLRRQERLKQLEEWEKLGWRREREEVDVLHEFK